ncbi:MAG: antibiotic biosynthesis monooxygenase [Nitrososphaerales archaeon]
MPYGIFRFTVEDYAKWKPVYDEHTAARKVSGSKGAQVLQNAENPNEIMIILEYESVEKAKAFSQSEGLRLAMQKAGVNSIPDIIFVNEVERTDG